MAETTSETSLQTQSRKRRKGASSKLIVAMVIIVALVCVIVYLLSLLNSNKYFLVPEGNKLMVKKGVFFLVGSEVYKGTTPKEAELYAPIELPPNFGDAQKEYPDLASLNSELAAILILRAQQLVFDPEETKYQKGTEYLNRLASLQGLDTGQLKLIQGLVADVDYIEAKRAYLGVEKTLEHALKKFKQAETFGTGRFPDAAAWIEKVDRLLQAIRDTKAGLNPAPITRPGSGPRPRARHEPETRDEPEPERVGEDPVEPEPLVAPPSLSNRRRPKGGI